MADKLADFVMRGQAAQAAVNTLTDTPRDAGPWPPQTMTASQLEAAKPYLPCNALGVGGGGVILRTNDGGTILIEKDGSMRHIGDILYALEQVKAARPSLALSKFR